MQITTIGLDLAKHWFQVHGVDADGQRRRSPAAVAQRRDRLISGRSSPVWSAWKPARQPIIGRVS